MSPRHVDVASDATEGTFQLNARFAFQICGSNLCQKKRPQETTSGIELRPVGWQRAERR